MKEKFEELVGHLIDAGFFLEEAVELLEKSMIQSSLERSGGNQTSASKALGIHRNTLLRKMVCYELGGKKVRRKPPAKAKAKRKATVSKRKTS